MFIFTKKVLSWQRILSSLASQIREAAKRCAKILKTAKKNIRDNMKIIKLFFFSILMSQNLCAQMEIDGKPLNDEQKKMVKETFSKQKVLSQNAENSCKCIDSISINSKNAVETSKEVKRCIDNEVVGYQSTLKLMETVDVKEGEKITVSIFTDPESNEYKKYYYEIETKLMESCPAIKNVVGMNNKESEKSVSKNSDAIKEYNKGNEFIRQKDYKSALPFYEKAVKIDSEFVFAWDNIGVCNRRLGNLDEALKAYKMSLKLDPKSLTALQNIALVYVGQKKYQKAIDSYNNLAKVDKENPEVYYGIGVIYYENILDNEKALDNICKAYNLYVAQSSPYRTDAEKIIQSIYTNFKAKGKQDKFNEILKSNNISSN